MAYCVGIPRSRYGFGQHSYVLALEGLRSNAVILLGMLSFRLKMRENVEFSPFLGWKLSKSRSNSGCTGPDRLGLASCLYCGLV